MSAPGNISALLLPWLKANSEQMAADLRDAGWEEDEHGTWHHPPTKRWRYHLFDAHEIVRSDATPERTGR